MTQRESSPDGAGYRAINLANWNCRVPFHERGYRLERYRQDASYLSHVVRFDVPRLGGVRGLSAVHLQCHLGTDTISLARLGAHVVGLDFSAPALAVARLLAQDCGAAIDYVEADAYDAVAALGGERFDLVYTGLGALCWLPSVERWAKVVSGLLKPGGRLFIREGHPVLWALCDPRPDQLQVLQFPYFEVPGGTEFIEPKTYVEHDAPLSSPRHIAFNHGIGELITAVMGAGLRLTAFEEHQSVPWDPFGAAGVADAHGEYRLRVMPERLPASYTLQAVKG